MKSTLAHKNTTQEKYEVDSRLRKVRRTKYRRAFLKGFGSVATVSGVPDADSKRRIARRRERLDPYATAVKVEKIRLNELKKNRTTIKKVTCKDGHIIKMADVDASDKEDNGKNGKLLVTRKEPITGLAADQFAVRSHVYGVASRLVAKKKASG